jgi:hypothetical protein
MQVKTPPGWEWFTVPSEESPEAAAADAAPPDLPLHFARCLNTADGRIVLAHLESMTLRRVLPASASDAALRVLEGQRQLVAYIAALVARGMRG